MATHDNEFNGVGTKNVRGRGELTSAVGATIPAALCADDVLFVCIGTDKVSGDSYGPFVGTYLEEFGYDVLGTLDSPIHAMNITEKLSNLPSDKTVICVDASTTDNYDHIGTFTVIKGSIIPGKGMGKDLGKFGDYSIIGPTSIRLKNDNGLTFDAMRNVRLSMIVRMAKDTTSAIIDNIPLERQSSIVAHTPVDIRSNVAI